MRRKKVYEKHIKRILDFILSMCAVSILFPLLLFFTITGMIAMKGNPFFTQTRVGYKEKNFKLIKFRTMSNAKDKKGKLLPNDVRLNRYGRFLRSTSLDELPELLNIIKGDMSLIGPRPLLTEYLPYYTKDEHRRHNVRPGLTGLAQVNGRNAISSWEERFQYDLQYIDGCSLTLDIYIFFKTILKVVKRDDILVGSTVIVGRLDEIRKNEKGNKRRK